MSSNHSTSDDEDDSKFTGSDDNHDLDNLEELLENMGTLFFFHFAKQRGSKFALFRPIDIDKDYNMWSTFRSSILRPGTTEVVLSDDGVIDVQPEDTTVDKSASGGDSSSDQWKKRLQREEIYSSKYRPTVQEEAELKEVELLLGVTTTKGRFPVLFRSQSAQQLTDEEKSSWMSVARPSNQHPSLVLKRGPCLLKKTTDEDSEGSKECELILLTRGIVIATTANNSEKQIVSRQFYKAISLSDVEFVQPEMDEPMAFTIHLTDNDEKLEFLCVDRQAWLDAIEIVLIHYHEHCNDRTDLGWQYQLVYHAGFTMAVTNQTYMVTEIPSKDVLNRVDEFNGFAPLHYAVKLNHVPAISLLLEAGADPNIKDADGHTPMYWCMLDGLPETTIALLTKHGATECKEKRGSGELFGKVAATEAIIEERNREEAQKKQAEAAAAEMKNNMKLLQQRGEKIDELGNKANDLNQGAQDFASMAKQLKEASKKKRWYQL